MKFLPIKISWFAEKLQNKEVFSFVRYGDGEWRCILGYKGKNCDKHEYFPRLRVDLSKAVCSNKDMVFGIQNMSIRNMIGEIGPFLKKHNINRKWYDSDILHRANCNGNLYSFIKSLSEHKVAIIGPDHIRKSGIKFHHFVSVPKVNCYLKVDGIYKRTLDAAKECSVFLFCASMTSNVLMDRLFDVVGDRISMIDCGSIFDPYSGILSRGIYRSEKFNVEKMRSINILGESYG